jgi:hypothetical protein
MLGQPTGLTTLMTQLMSAESQLSSLNRRIDELRRIALRIKRDRRPFQIAAAKASFRLSQLRFRRWLRSPAKTYQLWKVGFLVIGAAAVAAVCFLLFINVSVSAAFVSCGLSAALTAAAMYPVLYYPTDARLTELIVDADIACREAETQLRNAKANDGLRDVELELRDLNTEKLELLETVRREIESGIRRRSELLHLNWRAMRDNEWENYLVEVFKALGAKAERIGCSGDQGCDLIVEAGQMRIAVQAKGYHNSVGNSAVQEAFAGMHYHGCNMCAVITNSRFTQSAQELAVSTRCVLISEQQIPDFVMGQVDFFRLRNSSSM